MVAVTKGPGGAGPRGRRTPRPTGDDRELAILLTAERLLEERSLADISVDDLARGAGISRPTFYFYFASKDAVLLTLLDRVIAEAESAAAVAGFLADLSSAPRQRWRECLQTYYETVGAHRAVMLACAEVRSQNPEVRRIWATIMETWVSRTAAAIEAERARGAAPGSDVSARNLAVALNAMNERVLYASFSGEEPAVAESDAVDVLLDVWLNSIYRTVDPASA